MHRVRSLRMGLLVLSVLLLSVPSTFAADLDPHSHARPEEMRMHHLSLDLSVNFDAKILEGTATLDLESAKDATELRLDVWDLDIRAVRLPSGREMSFRVEGDDPLLGSALIIELPAGTPRVSIDYASRPGAGALLWLDPSQTAGGEYSFLFSQSQTVFARTWMPVQDSPGIRFTYDATLRVPPGLMALMSAENPTETNADGVYRFRMEQPVPAYLLAIAVGDLEFASMGSRTGVYAEAALLESAAWEFADTEKMMEVADVLYGEYRWGRFDMLVLPPYFPFGGMENPRITFVTPTILAGDRSLVSLVAHELAHSWSGNLVTNTSWEDFWLNEGMTVLLERRIMEALEGREYSEMLALLGHQDLLEDLDRLGHDSALTALHVEMEGIDPEDSMTDIAYEKGYFFLRRLEQELGRESFDSFLRDYFDENAFGGMDSERFLLALRERFGSKLDPIDVQEWVYGLGLPGDCPQPRSNAFESVESELREWHRGRPARKIRSEDWNSHQWLHFLRRLPQGLPLARMAELDEVFGFTNSGNSEILNIWFQRSIQAWYEPAFANMERFLNDMGRRKFLRPIYTELAQTLAGKALACEIYESARPHYHPISTRTIDRILECQPSGR